MHVHIVYPFTYHESLYCCQFLSSVNEAVIDVCVQIFEWNTFTCHSGKHLEVELLSHVGVVYLNIFETTKQFSKVVLWLILYAQQQHV